MPSTSCFEAVRTKSCKDCIWKEILLCIISRVRELGSTWVCTMPWTVMRRATKE